MPTIVRSRSLHARPSEIWELVADPTQLARWWPRVERVEEATPRAWTNVMRSPRGRTIRADFTRTAAERPGMLVWARRAPVDLDAVTLPPPALSDSALGALGDALGEENVRTDRETRVRHAAGRSYPDLIRLRSGALESAPDAVVAPGSE